MRLAVKAHPGAGKDAVIRNDDGSYDVWVMAPPSDGRANEGVIRLLAKELGVAPSTLRIVRGRASRHKVVEY
ncbi:DUF167 domain-containing protein [Candidatus Uhrbacteria bacterium]|nr:DUF167 domain-containing protein [Candidatus Uhrbacteria bacterium]